MKNKNEFGLMLTLATLMPKERHIELIEEGLEKYRLTGEHNFLAAACHGFTLHLSTGGNIETAMKQLEEMEEREEMNNLFKKMSPN
jgi:hypothetical protein